MKWYAVIVAICLHLAIDSEAVPIANVASDQVASLMSPTPYMYKVPLSPENEVPRITDSKALGYLLIQFMPNTNALYYDVVVSNIYGPTIVHLHKGKPTTVGAATLMFLYNSTATDNSTAFTGRLCSGIMTPSDFVGPAKNLTTVSAFIDEYLKTDNLFSNVHTLDHPNGIMRGQINAKALQESLAARTMPTMAPGAPL